MPKKRTSKEGEVGAMQEESLPVLAYVGMQSEVLFLQTLLEGSGITSSIDQPIPGRYANREARLFVARSDVEVAAPLIADFREHGAKSGT